MRAQIGGMPQASGLDDLLQRMQRVVMEVEHAVRLVGDDQRALAHRVLRRDARRTASRVTRLRLNTPDRYGP